MIDTGDIDVFLGLDVGKGEHHATAVTPAGKKAFDKRMPNTEPKLRELFANSRPSTGRYLSWSTSRPRSGPCRWRSPGTWAARSPTCRA
ncbi:hypothetical protein GCM10018785_30410 [Streptomyces longispororuber]|uniref:Transposase IS110-like N-terminal domain-containing protein n=1 Tax=Streptomyces longispororuber TaxID=68230 RepID=A0A919DL53_9ACTN|nr:hypothetical protein GCM10018785_30410 [Streptomyces longispororuber]